MKTPYLVKHACLSGRKTRLSVFLLCLWCCWLAGSGSALANDLVIENFSATLKKNGVPFNPNSLQEGYLAGSDVIEADVELTVSWDCTGNRAPFLCVQDRPDFVVRMNINHTVGAVSHGRMVYSDTMTGGEVQFRNISFPQNVGPKRFTVTLSTDLVNQLLTSEYDTYGGGGYGLKIIIDKNKDVAEDDETNNSRIISIPNLVPLTGNLAFGGAASTFTLNDTPAVKGGVTWSSLMTSTASCGSSSGSSGNLANLKLTAVDSWTPAADGLWPTVTTNLQEYCVQFAASGSGFDLAAVDPAGVGACSQSAMPGPVAGSIAGFSVTVTETRLCDDGIHPGFLIVPLPDSLSYHLDDGSGGTLPGRPKPRGFGFASFGNLGVVNDFSAFDITYSGGFLQSAYLPFAVGIGGLHGQVRFTAAGFTGTFNSIVYANDRPFAATDPRAGGKVISNDRRYGAYRALFQSNRAFTITPGGLQVDNIDFGPGSGQSHFPLQAASWDGFSVTVVDSRLQDGQSLAGGSYALWKTNGCDGCTASGALQQFLYTTEAEGLAMDGTTAAYTTLPMDPTWGPEEPVNGRIFQRQGDAGGRAVLVTPGFVATGTGSQTTPRVSEYLLGMYRLQESAGLPLPVESFPLSSDTARKGNYFMAGLNVGPELYVDGSQGQTVGSGRDMTNSAMRIGFGGLAAPAFRTVATSSATKYVIRKAGVTGVFNTEPGILAVTDPPQESITVYGYPLLLDRFAFRTVNNIPDRYTWMDGLVHVPGKGNFDVVFQSLQLGCGGDVGAGLVARESCGDLVDNNNNNHIDENCAEDLDAWQTAIDLVSVGFVPENSGLPACESQNRLLEVGASVDLRALSAPLQLAATWDSAGDPIDTTVTGPTDHLLDQAGGSGFPFVLANPISLKTPGTSNIDGWFAIDGDIGTPLWNALQVSSRLANTTPARAAQSIVIGRGSSLTADDNAKTNAELGVLLADNTADSFTAEYQWGQAMRFSLPIYYESGRRENGLAPRFLGRTDPAFDLKVLELKAGVDYITPEVTRASFGASADFAKMAQAQFDLNVDLHDPESVAQLDSAFGTTAFSNIVTTINQPLATVNDELGARLDDVLEEELRGLLDALSPDPLTPMIDSLGAIQALPEWFASEVATGLEELTAAAVFPLSQNVEAEMAAYYTDAPAIMTAAYSAIQNGTPVDSVTLDGQIAALDNAWASLDQAADTLSSVTASLSEVEDNITALVAQVSAPGTGDVAMAVADIDALISLLGDSSRFGIISCSSATNDLIKRVDRITVDLQAARDALAGVDLLAFADDLAGLTGLTVSGIEPAQAAIDGQIDMLYDRLDTAVTDLDNALVNCPVQLNYGTAADAAIAFFTSLKDGVAQVATEIVTLQNDLLAPAGGLLPAVQTEVDAAFADLLVISDIIGEQRLILQRLRDGSSFDFPYPGQTVASIEADLNLRVSERTGGRYSWYDAGTSRSFVQQLADGLRQPIDQAVADAAARASTVIAPLVALLPHPTRQEVRDIVVDYVLNSAAVGGLTDLVDRYLDELSVEVNDISLDLLDQVNEAVDDLIRQQGAIAEQALEEAAGVVAGLPLKAARLDGYAVVSGNDLQQVHVGADWTMEGDTAESTTTYGAALDVTPWNANNKGGGCGAVVTGSDFIDAVISAQNLPIVIAGSDADIDEISLGFTFDGSVPKGVFGGISIAGRLDFQAFQVYDPAFAAGLGEVENYAGASAGASFDSVVLDLAFLVGKTCNSDVLLALDPQAAEFIQLPGGIFNGIYARGGASIPIIDVGCLLTVGVHSDLGSWLLAGPPVTVGGIVGGGAYGKVGCIGALSGKLTAFGQLAGNSFSFAGEGFAVAGGGFCEPETWTTISRSRQDKACGTFDAALDVTYLHSWDVQYDGVSGPH